MDIGKAFSYVFDDERWVTKVLLGGLLFLIPIVGQIALSGYMIKVAKNVVRNHPQPLPEVFDNFGETIVQGLYAFVINLVYFIPYILLAIVFSCIPGILGAGGDSGEAIAGLLALCLIPIYFIVALASAIVAYAGLARYIVTDNLSEALKIGEVISTVRSNPKPWFMLLLIVFLAGIVGSLGIIACGIGMIFTAFYAYCIMGHALGQTVAQQGTTSSYVPDMPGYDPQ